MSVKAKPYMKWEAIWSDELQRFVRFEAYTDKTRTRMTVCTLGLTPLEGVTLDATKTRLASANDFRDGTSARDELVKGPSTTFQRICDEVRDEITQRKLEGTWESK